MRFLVDAQLPARLARFLTDAGHPAVHTSELPDGNRTSDNEINRVVVHLRILPGDIEDYAALVRRTLSPA